MNKNKEINLQILSSVIFIIASFISLSITYNEKINNKLYTEKEALNISFYNRIIILISILISLYVSMVKTLFLIFTYTFL